MLGVGDYESAVRALPLAASEQDKLIELFSGEVDYLNDLSLSEKQTYVESVSYAQFLTERVGLATRYHLYFLSGAQTDVWARRIESERYGGVLLWVVLACREWTGSMT